MIKTGTVFLKLYQDEDKINMRRKVIELILFNTGILYKETRSEISAEFEKEFFEMIFENEKNLASLTF